MPADHDALYRRLSPDEVADRRAAMAGKGWTDPRDHGGQMGGWYMECPVLRGVARRDYCWERCPVEEPDGRCPRRAADPGWWWCDVPGEAPEPVNDAAPVGGDAGQDPGEVDGVDHLAGERVADRDGGLRGSVGEPTAALTPARTRGKKKRKRSKPGGPDVFDLFG